MSSKYEGETGEVVPKWWLDADMGVNLVENHNNVEGATEREFIGLFKLFGQITC